MIRTRVVWRGGFNLALFDASALLEHFPRRVDRVSSSMCILYTESQRTVVLTERDAAACLTPLMCVSTLMPWISDDFNELLQVTFG